MFGKKASVPASGGSVFGATTIAWEDQFKAGNIMWKVPRNIRLNDNIVVREDEIAVFYRDGKVLTYFDQPNRYALTRRQRAGGRKAAEVLHGCSAAGRGLLPPEEVPRRKVWEHTALPVH